MMYSCHESILWWYFLFGTITLIILALEASCFTFKTHHKNVHKISKFDGIGVTSILSITNLDSNNTEFYVGTKRGKIMRVVIPESRLHDSIEVNYISDRSSSDTNIAIKPYPIYSMAAVTKQQENTGYDLLCGGGDRYITIWESKLASNRNLEVKQQLGPHTGWVKDLALLPYTTNDNCAVFSIGCNCIEIWKYSEDRYKHMCKIQIESSVDMGSTLSSDLLCLAMSSSHFSDPYIFAGGVDGRLHRWKLPKSICDFKMSSDCIYDGVISAHNGRLNRILICHNLGILVTIGADGVVVSKSMSNITSFQEWETSTMNMNEVLLQSEIKLTSSCIVEDDLSRAIISVGSSCGKLFLVEMSRMNGSNIIHMNLLNGFSINDEDSVPRCIHAMQSCNFDESKTGQSAKMIVIGHAGGLSLYHSQVK